jgi:hypothetical protein
MRFPARQSCREVTGHPEVGLVCLRPGIRSWAVQWLLVVLLLSLPVIGASQELVTQNPYKVEAAFLRNFAHYVTWPPQAFSEDSNSWHICVLGPDPFGEVLEATLEGRIERGMPFAVFRAERLEDLPFCQILFIAFKDARRRRAALRALKEKPVLTVGEANDFLNEGGVIRFKVGRRVSMGINLDQSRRVLVGIQTKMLEVSHVILENGELRRMR